MSIDLLAPELLRKVLSNLDRHSLRNTSLVCRGWLSNSREIYWSHTALDLEDEIPYHLPAALSEGTTIPRHVGSIIIEDDHFDEREEEETAAWQKDLPLVLDHFESMTSLTIRYLNLTRFPQGAVERILRPGRKISNLVIQSLEARKPSDVIQFIIGSSEINFLGLGSFKFSEHETEPVDVDEPIAETVALKRLGHLVIFDGKSNGTWNQVIPRLMERLYLKELKTIVLMCDDGDVVTKLLRTAAPAIRSLGLGIKNEVTTPDLSQLQSLQNLSIDLSAYPRIPTLLLNAATTIISAPVANLEHVLINCGPELMKPEKQFEDAAPVWEKLDAHLSQVPGLKNVFFLMVIAPDMAGFLSMPGALGGIFETWKSELREYVEEKFPLCRKKGLVGVKQVGGSGQVRLLRILNYLNNMSDKESMDSNPLFGVSSCKQDYTTDFVMIDDYSELNKPLK